MKVEVLVTGVNGFVGHHVAKQLKSAGVGVIGVGNQPKVQDDLRDFVDSYVPCDLTDASSVAAINLSSIRAIINLAGFAKVGESRGQGELYNRVNVGVHEVLYNECLRQNVKPRIIAISTGAVYDPSQEMPITESSRLVEDSETNEYVVSKKLAEKAILDFNNKGLTCIIARPFNHTGPGQLPGFLLPDLYQQILDSRENGTALRVGNLETKRDFTDVRDVAKAYIDLALAEEDQLKHNTYNICSGQSICGKEILELLVKSCAVGKIQTVVDPSKIRNNEVMDIYGSMERIHNDIGWSPSIPIQQTIDDFVKARA